MSDGEAIVRALARLPWKAEHWKRVQNASAPGGEVDMYLLVDDDTGEGIVGVSVKPGTEGRIIAEYIVACCSRPWMLEPQPVTAPDLAVGFNSVLKALPSIDAMEVAIAAMTVALAYQAELTPGPRLAVRRVMQTMLNRAGDDGGPPTVAKLETIERLRGWLHAIEEATGEERVRDMAVAALLGKPAPAAEPLDHFDHSRPETKALFEKAVREKQDLGLSREQAEMLVAALMTPPTGKATP